MWAVMKAYSWKSFEIVGINLMPPPDGPQHFIPLFNTKKQALKFTNGDETNLFEMRTTVDPHPNS